MLFSSTLRSAILITSPARQEAYKLERKEDRPMNYERPEVLQVGSAEEVIQGGIGDTCDGGLPKQCSDISIDLSD